MINNQKNKLIADLSKIPKQAGCYLYKDSRGNIIYIGKAKNLFKRVNSYFTKKDLDVKTSQLVSQIHDVDFIVTNTEVEALILENNLIKKNSPKYNIDLKDSKRYAYLKLTKEKFPRLILARTHTGNGMFFGPFTSGTAREEIKGFLIKTFKLRTCRRFPKKACLRYHINLCDAPCVKLVDEKSYLNCVEDVIKILKGKTKEVIKKLNYDMNLAAKKEEFELARVLRNKIEALKYLSEKQNMQRKKKYDENILNYIVKKGQVYLILFNVLKGVLENKQNFTFNYTSDFLEEFILQYYSEHSVPKEIILPERVGRALLEVLSGRLGEKVNCVVPKIGEKKILLELVLKNIELQFFLAESDLKDLKIKLKLNFNPEIIECFDISHLSGTHTVASMVQFQHGIPNKKNYRRFKIKTVEGIDDFLSIAEVVRRRYSRLISQRENLPDLIVIDGGKGQLGYAVNELKNLGIKIPIVSLAKKLEEVFVPGLRIPLNLNKKSKALKLLQRIRDEAHRFAISYNRLLRKKELIKEI